MPTPLSNIIESLDRRILSDPRMGPETLERLLASQRELGLLHGDRPTCPFLRPHILGRSQYSKIRTAAETIALAFEKLVAAALGNPRLLAQLGLTDAEEKMARINPGYSHLCVTSRLDAYLNDSDFQFLEYNAENPAGVADQMQLEKILFALPHMKEFLEPQLYWRPEPHKQLLRSLLATYREWGGAEEHPHIAIVDWEGVSTASEFAVLKQYFDSEGYLTGIVDPHALSYEGEHLQAEEFRIDIVYKRVIIHEFLQEFDDTHALARAYRDQNVCMVNSFRAKAAHKKAGFAILSDPRYAELFSENELEVIRQHIPWTRIVQPGPTSFHDSERELVDILRNERERLVLKPNDDYGGQGVVIGWDTDPAVWEQAIAAALETPYVVQERVPVRKAAIPMLTTDGLHYQEMFVDFNPFLFRNEMEGALVRLSHSSLCNVSSGGGETALLVVDD